MLSRMLILAAGLSGAIGACAQSASDPLELSLHHATASVADLNRAVKWYQEKLGFKVALRRQLNPDAEIAWMVAPGFYDGFGPATPPSKLR